MLELAFIRFNSLFQRSTELLTEHINGLRTPFLRPTANVGDGGVVLDGLVGLTLGSGEDFGGWLEGRELTESSCIGLWL